ncbi:MAG TPA: hypothetical protein VF178_10870, partial [Gemmatimonadaceae bacterium]
RLTVVDSGGGQGVANAATQKVSASIAALEQVAGALGLDLDRFIKRIESANGDGDPVRVVDQR